MTKWKESEADQPVTDLKVVLDELTPGAVDRLLGANSSLRILRIDHSAVASSGASLLDLAMTSDEIRHLLVEMANHAFLAYLLKDGVTSFVQYRFIGKLWKRVSDGQFEIDENGLVYSIHQPLAGFSVKHIVVIFSAMAENIRTPYLMRHFQQDFADIQKYLPVGTAVLRIADLGGVVGGYYMNSFGLPDNEAHVQSLIGAVAKRLGTGKDDVVLYGKGKGASASLYHGLLGGYRLVAIDPVVSDDYNIKTQRDSHFTTGVFPERKQDKFARLCGEIDADAMVPAAIIYSERSPQFPCVTSVLRDPVKSNLACFNSMRADIKTAPDVMAKTLPLAQTLLTMLLYKLPVPKGIHAVDEVQYREDSGSRAP